MIPIISIVGKSDSGKTTLIEKIVPELVRRGYRICTVKHHLHDFEIDKEGKDSWRHKRAGAHSVIISSPRKVALTRDVKKEMSLEEFFTIPDCNFSFIRLCNVNIDNINLLYQ